MQPVPQDLLKEYVQSQHFTSTTEIMEAMKEMFRDVIQTVMEVEMDEELGRERCERSGEPEGTPRNYRNGYTKKTVKTQLGEVDIKVPRDRNGSFEPKIIGKYDRNADGMEDKILALYACGMSQRDIAEQIKELYGVEISPELVTKISEKIMPEVTAWQNRPLEPVYPFVFMDAIHYKVREDRRYVTKAAYVVLGVTMDGRKDILGVWIGEHENSKFWLNVLNDLKSRGVLDVYLFCTDGLCGMIQAKEIISTMKKGFSGSRPDQEVATALMLEANLGLRISDILRLCLSDIVKDGERYRLAITEQKTGKARVFTVPLALYQFIRCYCLDQGVSEGQRIFPLTERTVQRHLKTVCDYLGYRDISTHSFRKYYATEIYKNSHYNIALVQQLLQHSSAAVTQRYIGIQPREVEEAIEGHLKLEI